MKPLSIDLRQRVVDALQSGQTRDQVATRFAVSLSSVGRLARQWRERGNLEPRPIPGRARAVPQAAKESLQELLVAQEDWTLESLAEAFQEKLGKSISTSALQRNLDWLGFSYKKRVALPASATQRSAPPSKKQSGRLTPRS
jgi:transposase